MDAIRKAISEVKFRIPKAILEKAFITRITNWRQPSEYNLDDQILNLVLRPRVLVDCNIVGGQQALIPLEGLAIERPDARTQVIHIPKARTQGRSIVSVLHVAFLSQAQLASYAGTLTMGSSGAYDPSENSAAMGAAVGMLAALDKIPITTSANVHLVAENTILIRDVFSTPQNAYLRCMLANDENLNNLQIRSYLAFSKLVEYAVKSYIYNTLVIEVDTAELQGGQALGIFKTVMESYQDAEQNYQDYLKEHWTQIAVMNDPMAYARILKLTIGGHR